MIGLWPLLSLGYGLKGGLSREKAVFWCIGGATTVNNYPWPRKVGATLVPNIIKALFCAGIRHFQRGRDYCLATFPVE